jgi:hypothetical protein
MPVIDAGGCPIHVEVEGRADAPVLMLSNSLGTNHHMWDDQVKPSSSAAASPAPRSPCSMPPTFPISSSRGPMPTRCSVS